MSCINEVQDARFSLTGQGVLVAVIDSGVDYTLPDFRNEDGTTRIRYLWDQSLKAVEGEHVPKGYGMGVEYTKEEIDAAFPDFYHVITPKNIVTQGAITIRTRDISGHGTGGSRYCGWKWKRKRRCLCRSCPSKRIHCSKTWKSYVWGIPKDDGAYAGN